MEIDKNSGTWGIAVSYAYDEAKARGIKPDGTPENRGRNRRDKTM